MALDGSGDLVSRTETESDEETLPGQLQRDSLASMFERFLEQQGQDVDDVTNTCGIIFMSDASPLTFALGEARNNDNMPVLHDAGSHFSKFDRTGTIECAEHPAHLSHQDIGYLKVKGAFQRPTNEALDPLAAAFIERFYPSYSIVELSQFEQSLKSGTLPWILLHAVCFIGSTFCDLSVIHRAGFKGRWQARHQFYDKAKLLFDIGYETNKIVLLQSVLMLSFWGPQMKSYWNPCSWVGFGVTIAESLGIHRMSSSTHVDGKRRSLLKRLFWVLAVRDAYCATLLGRPCRLNIAQCDTQPLGLDDFGHDRQCNSTEDHAKCQSHANYQIQVSKLSLILRSITEARFGPGKSATMIGHLHSQLERWQTELPPSLSWGLQQTTDVFALSLKIIFHLQLILIHLDHPDEATCSTSILPNPSISSSQVTESSAYIISSTAFTIISNSMLGVMPHEIFQGFFVAGIVFYRGIKHPQGAPAHLPQSALDNCQMVMSEARGRWDPASWVLRIFDFLLSSNTNPLDTAGQVNRNKSTMSSNDLPEPGTVPVFNDIRVSDIMPQDDILHSIDFGSPGCLGMGSIANEFFQLSNYLPMAPENSLFESM
ncbi:Fc.00g055870.m01.CDS01 [Cosmosporella sp. VM-42]